MIKIDICKGCDQNKPIVNRKYFLCPDCNTARLHGSDWKEKKLQRQQELLKTKVVKASSLRPQKHKLKQISKTNTYLCSDGSKLTQSQINQKYIETCKMIDLAREPICETCGRGDRPLSHSHIISQKRCKEIGKADLISDENNILLECFEPPASNSTYCHNIWEYGSMEDKKQSKTWLYKLAYIKEHDPEQYQKLINR